MKIYLEVQNLRKRIELSVDYDNASATLNGKEFKLDVSSFSRNLITIVSSWEEEMINYNVLDGLSYRVTIEKDGKSYNYVGQNKFPNNFREFMELLSEVGVW